MRHNPSPLHPRSPWFIPRAAELARLKAEGESLPFPAEAPNCPPIIQFAADPSPYSPRSHSAPFTITAENLRELRAIQEHSGIRAILIYLNRLTDYRFTALFRFDDESLHNLVFFDRLQPEIVSCPEIP